MSDAILWPCSVLTPRNRLVDPAYRSVSGGTAINGFSQVVSSDAGIWKATFDQVVIRNAQQVKAWRAIRAHTEGRLRPVLICLCEGRRRPLPPGVGPSNPALPHSDEAFFADDSGYVTRLVGIRTSSSAALRATTLILSKQTSVDLEPGQRFSIGERLYEIRKIVSQSNSSATVNIWPPLREAVPSGSDVEFDRPVLRVRLETDAEMDLMLELNRFGSPTVNFVEDMSS
ncbi:hypothetical protein [Brucella pseudogrignonensis]|uniref:hypothetical protein n=1 Tax=Brucella pseudogrignonensis TaxID=419475 RepID=UPI003ECE45A4